ncbi:MAG: efflux RND transporter periplasmic adaptor subunit [candidate division Zixibacteria bacterium]|nr:efflux RND transporter periplasmic adaptor subunit [candidate division Zixibacteria bacterium]
MIRHIFGALVTAAILASVCLSCGEDSTEKQANTERDVAVMVQIIQPSDNEIKKTYTSSLEGERQAVIYCKIAEAVEKVHVHEGERIEANQVIVSLDKSGPSSNYQQALSVYKNAEKQHNKMAYLYEEGAVSESAADAARTEYEVHKAAFEAASKLVNIPTPISGTVTSINVSKGDYLSAGQTIATVASIEKLRAKFSINASDLNLISLNDSVNITVDALDLSAVGTVISVARSADPSTRAYQVEAIIDNSRGLFTPGMFARVSLVVNRLENVLMVPRKALLSLSGKNVVYIVNGMTARQRVVELGPEVDGQVVILSGIKSGDTLVVLGQNYLEDGDNVNITGTVEVNNETF